MNDHPPRVPKASRRSNKLVERTEKKGPLTIRKTTPNRSPLIDSPVKVCDRLLVKFFDFVGNRQLFTEPFTTMMETSVKIVENSPLPDRYGFNY